MRPSQLRLWLLWRPILLHIWQFGIQSPHKGMESHTHLPNKLPQVGEHCIISKQNLGDLDDSEFCQLMGDLMWEIAQCKMHVPPSNPPPNEWVHPSGSTEPKEDDQEVTFPGGGRWGPLRQPTPPVEPERPAGGRVPSGPPPRAPCPAPAGSDMGQLITALTLGLHIGTPKINTFSGWPYPWKDRGIIWAVEPWGSVYKRPLPRVSGLGKHYAISQRGSSRHGLIHGPYCWCPYYFR